MKKRFIFILLLSTFIFIYISGLFNIMIGLIKGYSFNTITVFKENENIKNIITNKYSKTLEVAVNSNNYQEKYLDEYLNINYVKDNDFIININALLDRGYNEKEINSIYSNVNMTDIYTFLNYDYNKKNIDILNVKYFKNNRLDRYLEYVTKNNNMSSEKIVEIVNMNLDKNFYTDTKEVNNLTDIEILVNKYNYLPNDYIPLDLESVSLSFATKNQFLRKEAKYAFEKMASDALLENIHIYAGSTYRSYKTQTSLYNYYVKKDTSEIADTYSARPGFSEHQTGLAVDILNHDFTYISQNDIEYSWLISNSYKYGFVLRYPENKINITGYKLEEWHFRYFGVELATKLFNSNLTYEEYLAKL